MHLELRTIILYYYYVLYFIGSWYLVKQFFFNYHNKKVNKCLNLEGNKLYEPRAQGIQFLNTPLHTPIHIHHT